MKTCGNHSLLCWSKTGEIAHMTLFECREKRIWRFWRKGQIDLSWVQYGVVRQAYQHSQKINSQYVILLLDDFLVDGNINQNMIDRCIEYLDKDRKIACFSFYPSKWRDVDNGKYPGFELRPLYGEYRFNMQAALWRKKDLLRILTKNETPWQTEERGTFRARVLFPRKEF